VESTSSSGVLCRTEQGRGNSNLDQLDFLHPAPATRSGEIFVFSLPVFEHVWEQRRLARALLGRRGGGLVVARGEQLLSAVVRQPFSPAMAGSYVLSFDFSDFRYRRSPVAARSG
jgi:hypothetical protein